MKPYYTQENTQGYTDEQLAAFNRELWDIFADAKSSNPDLTDDDVHEIIQRHNQDVSDRD